MRKTLCILLSLLTLFLLPSCQKEPSVDPSASGVQTSSDTDEGFDFIATDFDGNIVRFSDFNDAELIMINFWEPWCRPCVGEMPDIEKIYTQYRDRGLVVLGVFTTQGMDDSVRDILDECNITYPILRGEDERLLAMQTDYVPTTVFLNAKGDLLTEEPIVGACSFEEWETTVSNFLQSISE